MTTDPAVPRPDAVLFEISAVADPDAHPGGLALAGELRRAGVRTALLADAPGGGGPAGPQEAFDAVLANGDAADPAALAAAAARLGAEPGRAALVAATAGVVAAGRTAGIGQVIAVDREGAPAAAGGTLAAAGADPVVADLAELALLPGAGLAVRTRAATPSVWAGEAALRAALATRRPAVFLDYDGVLAPIVEDPAKAVIGKGMEAALLGLAARLPVAIVSGRDLADVRRLLPHDGLHFAGSHGFDLAGPGGWQRVVEAGRAFLPALAAAAADIEAAIAAVPGARLERKRFALAVHTRQVAERAKPDVAAALAAAMERHPRLRAAPGKEVHDVRPRIDWHKGRAVLALLDELGAGGEGTMPVYLGDDTTDEDAFRILAGRGVGIVVRDGTGADRPTAARHALDGTDEVERFLGWLAALTEAETSGP